MSHYSIYLFEILSVVSSIRAVSSKNPVSSVLWLTLVFLSSSLVIFYLAANFIGLVIIVVYIGAIAVLFLFVVMMLNIRTTESSSQFLGYVPMAGIMVVFQTALVASYVRPGLCRFSELAYLPDWAERLNLENNITVIGECLYTYYSPMFLTSSIILLTAAIAAIFLTQEK